MAARITQGNVNEVRRLKSQGFTERRIAEKTGLGRATVSGILRGRVKAFEYSTLEKHVSAMSSRPMARCPTCGGMVYMPCILCEARAGR